MESIGRVSSRDRGNNFDAIRAVAALAVVVSHSFPIAYGQDSIQPLGALSHGQTNLGSMAVLIFFVLSGYLITQSFDRSPKPLRFLLARSLRIFPALFVVLVLTAAVLGPAVTSLSLGQYFTESSTTKYVLAGLSLFRLHFHLEGVFQGNPGGGIVNGSLWTLAYEFTMYLVVLVLGICRLLTRGAVTWLWAGALVLLWIGIGGFYVEFATPFLSGAVLYLWRDRVPLDGRLALLSAAVLVAGMVAGGFRPAFTVFGAYIVMYAVFAPALRLPSFTRWGDLSYGIYIVSYPVQQTASMLLGPNVTWYSNFFLSLPFILALAWLSWHVVEKPALRLKSSLDWAGLRNTWGQKAQG